MVYIYIMTNMEETLTINETWRSIDGYINHQVSNIGRVRNVTTRCILEPRFRGEYRNYHSIALYINAKQTNYSVHRLVAQEFIPSPENKPHVDHANKITIDNNVGNLRWVTNQKNMQNTFKNTNLNCSSQYKGVSKHKQFGRWMATICHQGTNKYLGLYALR